MEIQKYNLVDKLICILTSFMIMSFYLFEMKSWGRYVLFGITILITLLYASQNNGRIRVKPEAFHYHVLLFSLFCFVSSVWAWNASLAISKGVTIFLILVCYSFIYGYYQSKGSIEPLLRAIMYAGYGIAIYSLFYYRASIISMITGGIRLGNDYTNANSMGMVAAISLVIQFYYVLRKRINLSVICVLPSIVILAASQSRKATVLLVIGVFFLTVFIAENKNVVKTVMRIMIAVLLLIVIFNILSRMQAFSGLFGRFQTYFESLSGSREENIRDIYRQIGQQQFLKTPILGIGMGNSAELLESVGQRRTYLHDNFVEILSSGGIIGFTIYYSIYWRILTGYWKFRKYASPETHLCFILAAIMLIMDYGMVSYFDKQQYIYFMCFFLQLGFIKKNSSSQEVMIYE